MNRLVPVMLFAMMCKGAFGQQGGTTLVQGEVANPVTTPASPVPASASAAAVTESVSPRAPASEPVRATHFVTHTHRHHSCNNATTIIVSPSDLIGSCRAQM